MQQDLFDNLVPFNKNKSPTLEEQRLAAVQPKTVSSSHPIPSKKSTGNTAVWDFDALEKSASKSAAAKPIVAMNPTMPSSNSAPSSSLPYKPSNPQSTTSSQPSDPFDFEFLEKKNDAVSMKQPIKTEKHIAEETKHFETAPFETNPASHSVKENANDEMLAQLIDMGYDPQSAAVALMACEYESLSDAINLLSATNNSPKDKHRQTTYDPKPYKHDGTSKTQKMMQSASDIGVSMFTKASAMFNSSKKVLAEKMNGKRGSIGKPGEYENWEEAKEVMLEQDDFGDTSGPISKVDGKAKSPAVDNLFDTSVDLYGTPPAPRPIVDCDKPIPPVSYSSTVEQPKSNVVYATLSSEQSSRYASLFQKAGELYKQGQYGDGLNVFSQALAVLPPNSTPAHFIETQYYIASCRFENGDQKSSIQCCSASLELFENDSSLKYTQSTKYVELLNLRARAYEALERFNEAINDYSVAIGLPSGREIVGSSLDRCKKSIAMASKPAQVAPLPTKTIAMTKEEITKSAAVQSLRSQAVQQEKEATVVLENKDRIDAQIVAWKKGKENNIRALIASLETVLWKELEWVPVPLSDLILPQKVKAKYMKIISKLHPDKLSTGTSIENRMIAQSVFTALNEAWESFKAQNGL